MDGRTDGPNSRQLTINWPVSSFLTENQQMVSGIWLHIYSALPPATRSPCLWRFPHIPAYFVSLHAFGDQGQQRPCCKPHSNCTQCLVPVLMNYNIFVINRCQRQQQRQTRHVFVKHGCPRRQQSQNMAKISMSFNLTLLAPHPGAWDVSKVWGTKRWTYSPSLVTVSSPKL